MLQVFRLKLEETEEDFQNKIIIIEGEKDE